ncbi:SCO2522 family protein [Frankia sp. R82]|uniref:SCO2522 family protein n=1 Tax=Frankia sp. R82 TaxID=2950553 RepID=UPI002044253F|nr:SCO2522 family protein [Frankia sp. R82]MCM3882081.1 SCO2522 family protein [Frankia sp. R82]
MDAVYVESSALARTSEVPLAQVSVELGHLYLEDLHTVDLDRFFARIAPWVDEARVQAVACLPAGRRPRVSTCLLLDDYSSPTDPQARPTPSPTTAIPRLLAAAERAGTRLDYLARESALAQGPAASSLADLVEGLLVADPPFGANGSRPPVTQTGWLTNGQRSPSTEARQAMGQRARWAPPTENGRHLHSIFHDVELWSSPAGDGTRNWSCAYLAAVWQLVRLGVLRRDGGSAVAAELVDPAELPDSWSALPAVTQVTRTPAPLCAYRTLSVLDSRFLPVEAAVRTILCQVAADPVTARQAVRRATAEGIDVPLELINRISYVLLGP